MNRNYFILLFLLIALAQCKSKKNRTSKVESNTLFNLQALNKNEWQPIGPFHSPTPLAQKGEWSPHGNGRFMCVNVHPDNSNELIIGHATSGIFKTTDGGKTWQQKLSFEYATGIFKIIRFRKDKNHLIACSGMDIGNSRQYGFGLFESFDNGETWSRNALQFNPEEYNLEQSRDIAFTQTKQDDKLITITINKVFISNNNGKDFTKTLDTKHDLKTITVNPINENEMYVTGSGILKSTDGGNTWQDLTQEINSKYGLSSGSQRITVSYSIKNKGFVYLFVQSNTNILLYGPSNDLSQIKIINQNTDIIPNRSRQVSKIIYHEKTNQESLFIGTTRIFRSNDDGKTFQMISSPVLGDANNIHDDINDIYYHSKGIYCATDGGIDFSADHGNTWVSLTDFAQNLNTALIFGFDYNPESGILMCGTQDNGIFKLQNQEWQCFSLYGDGGRCVGMGDSFAFSCGFAQMNHLTFNGGKNWLYHHAGTERTGFEFRMYYHKKKSMFYLANMHLYRQEKNKRFEIITSQLQSDRFIKALWVNPDNENEIWIGKDDPTWGGALKNKLFRTLDGGNTWIDYTENLPILLWRSITDIAMNASGEIAITIDGFDKNNSKLNKVYISSDDGQTFNNVSEGLPNLPNNCIISINNRWICGNNTGVYELIYDKWQKLGSNFPASIVTELKYFENEKTIIASTFGRGLWAIKF
jgi:photosystem II stability/assembly factor-like uncharacterized protein